MKKFIIPGAVVVIFGAATLAMVHKKKAAQKDAA